MQTQQLVQGYFNPKQFKLPLSFEVKIPFDSEARTFDEVFRRIDFRQYIVAKSNVGRIGYNPVNMLKLILFCMMENITTLRGMDNVKFEVILVAIGYNLSKLHKKKFRLS